MSNPAKHRRIENEAAKRLDREEIRAREPRNGAHVDPPVHPVSGRGARQRRAEESVHRRVAGLGPSAVPGVISESRRSRSDRRASIDLSGDIRSRSHPNTRPRKNRRPKSALARRLGAAVAASARMSATLRPVPPPGRSTTVTSYSRKSRSSSWARSLRCRYSSGGARMAEIIRPGRQPCPAEEELRRTFTWSVSPGLRASSILRTLPISALEVTGIP
jgi:hypothetical protein